MQNIKSKRNLGFLIVTLAILMIFGFVIYTLLSDIHSTKEGLNSKHLLGAITLSLLSSYYIYKYIKVPSITINNEIIIIKNIFSKKQYDLKDIDSIILNGKFSYYFIINIPAEGICIKFKNKEKIYLFDGHYSNLWKIKSILDKRFVSKNRKKKKKIFYKNRKHKREHFHSL